MQCLEHAGKTFTLYGRDKEKQARFGIGERNYNSIAGEALWADDTCTKRRYAELADVATATRLADALPHINLVGAMADPQDVPAGCRCVATLIEQLKSTTKPVHFWFNDRASAHYIMEVLIAVAGSESAGEGISLHLPFPGAYQPVEIPASRY